MIGVEDGERRPLRALWLGPLRGEFWSSPAEPNAVHGPPGASGPATMHRFGVVGGLDALQA
jgi:hypothetical protein